MESGKQKRKQEAGMKVWVTLWATMVQGYWTSGCQWGKHLRGELSQQGGKGWGADLAITSIQHVPLV